MQILHVSTLYPPELNAGGTLACHHLVRALQRRGHDLGVYAGTMSRADLSEVDFVHDGVPVRTLGVAWRYGPIVANYHHPEAADRFRRYVERIRPDVVHFHSIQALGGDVVPAARAAGARTVVTMHDGWFFCAQQFLVTQPPELRKCAPLVQPEHCDCIGDFDFVARRQHLDRCLESADRVLVPSHHLADLLRTNGVAPDRIRVCPNGLPAARPLPHTSSALVRFAFLGGPHPWKGAGTIAGALAHVDDRFQLDLHGVDAPHWRHLSGARSDDRVRLHPAYTPEQLPRILARADVVIVPSLVVESFSLVCREAMQHGIPVIAAEAGGPQEIVRHGHNGLLFPRGDERALAGAIKMVVRDAHLRRRMSTAAADTAVTSIDEQAKEVEAVYRDISRPAAPKPAGALPRRVLFLSGIEGAPHRYRVSHLVEQLELLGVPADDRWYRDADALKLAGESDLVVFYRVPWDAYVAKVLSRARAAGAVTAFSVDDLIFDDSLEVPALKSLGAAERRAWAEGVRLYGATLERCDVFLGSTEALARAAAGRGKPAFVHRNTLSKDLLRLSEAARDSRPREAAAGVRVAYFSGTRTHGADFAVVAEPLAAVMQRHPAVRLVIVGHLELPSALRRFAERVERVRFVPWPELPRWIAAVDVNLAPLEPGTFADAKSELKYFEAAAVGIPTIATPTEAFRLAIRDGDNGVLAATGAEWERKLDELVSSAEVRERIGRAAREDAYRRYTPHVAAEALRETLGRIMDLRGATPLAPLAPVTEADYADVVRAGIGVGRVALEPRDAIPGPAQVAYRKPTPRLWGSVKVTQRFHCPAGQLFRLDVMVGTHHSVNHHDIRLRITDAVSGQELATAVGDAALACDNAWFAFELPPVRTGGADLVATFEAPVAAPFTGLSLWTEPNPQGGGSCPGEEGFDIAYRTWLRPPGWKSPREIEVSHLPPEEAIRRLAELAERERVRRDELGRKLERLELRMVLVSAEVDRWRTPIERVRATLAYRALRKVYRLGKRLVSRA